jgi:hypothetical protein
MSATETQHTGGPAFPHLRRHVGNNTYEQLAEGGMTLRDYFAAKAMQGIVSNVPHLYQVDPSIATKKAYEFADAMLSTRGTEKTRED